LPADTTTAAASSRTR